MRAVDCPGLRWPEIHERFPHLSYRQIDYWSRNGRLTPHQHDVYGTTITDRERFQSGHVNCWPTDQVAALGRYNQLARYGLKGDQIIALASDRQALLELISTLTKIDAELAELEGAAA